MPEKIITVKLVIENTEKRKELDRIVSSLQGFRVQDSSDQTPCDILFIETGKNPNQDLQKINSAKTSGSAREIILTSPRFEPDFMIQAVRAGVKEFLIQPINKEEVEKALVKFRDSQETIAPEFKKTKKGKIINIIGSKGGIGTTTVAVNLATSLIESRGSLQVALVDMNLIFGEIPIFLNLNSAFNWGELARNISRVDSTYLMSIMTKHPSGLYVLPSPTGLDGINLASPEIMEKILALMRNAFDYVVIDSGQSLDDISLKILEMSDIVFIAAILSLPCLSNVKKLLWIFKRIEYPGSEKIKIVVNRFHKKSLISLKEAEKALNQEIFHLIANDYQTTMSAINQGKPLSVIAPREEISNNFRDLVMKIEKER